MLYAHNFYRKAHNASDLRWNDTLAEIAGEWAEGCEFEHSGGPTGENLAMGYPNATANVDAWALERKMYDFRGPTGFSSETGHFTQVVWRNTTSVGCGRRDCKGENGKSSFSLYVVLSFHFCVPVFEEGGARCTSRAKANAFVK